MYVENRAKYMYIAPMYGIYNYEMYIILICHTCIWTDGFEAHRGCHYGSTNH